jgi:hypothetical protein
VPDLLGMASSQPGYDATTNLPVFTSVNGLPAMNCAAPCTYVNLITCNGTVTSYWTLKTNFGADSYVVRAADSICYKAGTCAGAIPSGGTDAGTVTAQAASCCTHITCGSCCFSSDSMVLFTWAMDIPTAIFGSWSTACQNLFTSTQSGSATLRWTTSLPGFGGSGWTGVGPSNVNGPTQVSVWTTCSGDVVTWSWRIDDPIYYPGHNGGVYYVFDGEAEGVPGPTFNEPSPPVGNCEGATLTVSSGTNGVATFGIFEGGRPVISAPNCSITQGILGTVAVTVTGNSFCKSGGVCVSGTQDGTGACT